MTTLGYISIGFILGLIAIVFLVYKERNGNKNDIHCAFYHGVFQAIFITILWPVLVPTYFILFLCYLAVNKIIDLMGKNI